MECKFCGRIINNIGSAVAHEKSCTLNPCRVPHNNRSVLAGAKKGCIPWNKGITTGVDRRPNEVLFTENSSIARHMIKARILKHGLITYVCSVCGQEPFWNGKPMVLILDHINGINNDNRIENLRFVCSNCDSQLATYKSRNRK